MILDLLCTYKHFVILFVILVLINVYSVAPDLKPVNDQVDTPLHHIQDTNKGYYCI